jgi:hypothetical protein
MISMTTPYEPGLKVLHVQTAPALFQAEASKYCELPSIQPAPQSLAGDRLRPDHFAGGAGQCGYNLHVLRTLRTP